jgi:hypothetical protein
MSLKRADETTRRGIKADLDQWRPRKRVESAQNGHKVSHAKGSSDKVPPEHDFSAARLFQVQNSILFSDVSFSRKA